MDRRVSNQSVSRSAVQPGDGHGGGAVAATYLIEVEVVEVSDVRLAGAVVAARDVQQRVHHGRRHVHRGAAGEGAAPLACVSSPLQGSRSARVRTLSWIPAESAASGGWYTRGCVTWYLSTSEADACLLYGHIMFCLPDLFSTVDQCCYGWRLTVSSNCSVGEASRWSLRQQFALGWFTAVHRPGTQIRTVTNDSAWQTLWELQYGDA